MADSPTRAHEGREAARPNNYWLEIMTCRLPFFLRLQYPASYPTKH
jgi:hypothetical protein